jgi:hypothetical protein
MATACQQVVDLNLHNSSTQLIIEGSVNNTAGPYRVMITQSVNFYHDNSYPNISGARVIIADSTAAVTDTLSEVGPGIYETHAIVGRPGNTYTLRAWVAGKLYTATSTMPQPVSLDSVTFNYATKNTIRAVANFRDPGGIVNYYKFTTYVNGKYLNELHTFEDRLSDGRYIREKMDNDTTDIKNGDYVLLTLMGIDKAVDTYLNEAQTIAYHNSNLVAPATPQTNIAGGALGYFSAETISSKNAYAPATHP